MSLFTFSTDDLDQAAAIVAMLKGSGSVAQTSALAPAVDNPEEVARAAAEAEREAAEPGITFGELKKIVQGVKKDKGEQFILAILDTLGVDGPKLTLGRRMSKVPEDQYAALVDLMNTTEPAPEPEPEPTPEPEVTLDEAAVADVLEEDTLEETPVAHSVDEVKSAIRSFAKGSGRDAAIDALKSAGLKKLADIDDATPEQLIGVMAAIDVADDAGF